MPRPSKCRRVEALPQVDYFKPRGVPMMRLDEVFLTLDQFEALRLADYEDLAHDRAAERMNISRQTFGRVLASARKGVAKALVTGQALRIEGGHYEVRPKKQGADQVTGKSCRKRLIIGQNANKESKMGKIAVTSEGPSLADKVDPRFGRAAGFVVIDPETMEHEYVDNGNSQAMAQGAGMQAADNLVGAGVEMVLTGYVGPKAFRALDAAGIKVAQDMENLTVEEAVARYKENRLNIADRPNKQGHWK